MYNDTRLKVALLGGESPLAIKNSKRSSLASSFLGAGIQCRFMNEALEIETQDTWVFVVSKVEGEDLQFEKNWNVVTYEGQEDQQLISQVKEFDQSGPTQEKPWKPWFPVIDYDRCTNCMQCLSFCLFDVYSVKDEMIHVQNQDKCKTDCPACSRVCPEAAILFPKYKQSPINGAEVDDASLSNEKMKVDISTLLGGDIYANLRNRSQHANTRFSKERSEDRALKERKKCLVELKRKLDIPDSVLASLPTDEMIQEKLNGN
jgi:ferredoxin